MFYGKGDKVLVINGSDRMECIVERSFLNSDMEYELYIRETDGSIAKVDYDDVIVISEDSYRIMMYRPAVIIPNSGEAVVTGLCTTEKLNREWFKKNYPFLHIYEIGIATDANHGFIAPDAGPLFYETFITVDELAKPDENGKIGYFSDSAFSNNTVIYSRRAGFAYLDRYVKTLDEYLKETEV